MSIELNKEEKELLEFFLEIDLEKLGFEEDEIETLKGILEKLKKS